MSSNTHTTHKEWLQNLYDALMRQVEPELTSDLIDDVEFFYLDETPEERSERMEHYREALHIVEERFEAIVGAWREELLAMKKKFMKKKDMEQHETDQTAASMIEKKFDASL